MIQYGKTAIMLASDNGHLSVVEYLVQQGAAINIQDKVRNSINIVYYFSLFIIFL